MREHRANSTRRTRALTMSRRLRAPTPRFSWLCALAGGAIGAACANPAQDYMLYCMGCHGAQAEGVPGKVPPLAHSLGLLHAHARPGATTCCACPGAANSALSDAQLAAVLNWLAQQYNAEELTRRCADVHRRRSHGRQDMPRWYRCWRRGARWCAIWPPPEPPLPATY